VDPTGLSRRRGAPRLGDLVPEAFTNSKEPIEDVKEKLEE